MSDIFISYARENLPEARCIAEALHDRGLSVFWDRTIPTGHTFEIAIEQALASAKAVVVLWSCHSVRSDWVRAEASEGASRGILVPATLDGERPPLRYRIAQTANLSDWTPGTYTESFAAFLKDVAETALRNRSVTESRDTTEEPADGRLMKTVSEGAMGSDRAKIRRYLNASLGCAWCGSLALAVTAAYDYGVIRHVGNLWAIAYLLTLLALIVGALASIVLGGLSFRRQLVFGTLQGWVWPVLAAAVQVVILTSASGLIHSLPFVSEFEGLLMFVLCGTIGPGLLTVGAVVTNRSLDGRR